MERQAGVAPVVAPGSDDRPSGGPDDLRVFALDASREFGERVAAGLGLSLAPHEERDFPDGEHEARPLVNVRGRHAVAVLSLHGDDRLSVDDKLCRLLFFLGALRDAAAGSVTAVAPYLCFARKDRKTQPRDPVTTRYVAALFEAVGTDRILTCDVHNLAAYQNAFRCGADHLEARGLFVAHLLGALPGEDLVAVSPDAGGMKRATRFREALQAAAGRPVAFAVVEKARRREVVVGGSVVGDVAGRAAIVIDDMVSTGTTLVRAARACRAAGATSVMAAATHAVFSPGASEALADESLARLVVTDTVPPAGIDPGIARAKLTVLDAAPLFAEAIARIHAAGSLVDLAGD